MKQHDILKRLNLKYIKTLSMIQANVPPEKKGKVMGSVRTAMTLLGMVGVYGFSKLFKRFPTSPLPFWVMLGVLAAFGAYYLWSSIKLSRYAKGKGTA